MSSFWIRRILLGIVLLSSAWLWACADRNPPLIATLTFKKDSSHFTGPVIRREVSSITIAGASGEAHTFLYTELSDIKYGATDNATSFSGVSTQSPSPAAATGDKPHAVAASAAASGGGIQFREGTELPVRSSGFLDSCCVPVDSIALGIIDADIKSADGRILIPEGASVTILVRDIKQVDGRIQMVFELGSADFDNRHYLVLSANGSLAPGAVVTFAGAQTGSPEAKLRGQNVHLDDHTYMAFKTATPTIFKLSK